MDVDRLKTTLKQYLSSPIATEEKVLFVLVGARKLMEQSSQHTSQLTAARLMTDWAVHSVIDRNSWSRNALLFLDEVIGKNNTWDELPNESRERLIDIMGLDACRSQLMDVFRDAGIPPVSLGHPLGWQVFLEKFGSLINGCSLKLKDGKCIDRVTMSLIVNPTDRRECIGRWTFFRLTNEHTHRRLLLTCLLMLSNRTFTLDGAVELPMRDLKGSYGNWVMTLVHN